MRIFSQITKKERTKISYLRSAGFSISEIARRIGKHKSSVSRELKRNADVITSDDIIFWYATRNGIDPFQFNELVFQSGEIPENEYNWTALSAQRKCEFRRMFSNKVRKEKSRETIYWIKKKIKNGWSPEQIAGRSKIDGPEAVSHEYVYRLIKQDRKCGGQLFKYLKRFRKRKQRLSVRTYGKIGIKDRVGIEERPRVVEKRTRDGDLEADLIQGYKSRGHILTVLDRKSRYVVLEKLPSKHASVVSAALIRAIKQFGSCKTITVDNGREFAGHKQVSQKMEISFYFGRPYMSNDRGSVENMNGLIRFYLPKKTSFVEISNRNIKLIQKKLNERPKKCLNFLTPKEVFRTKE